MPTSLIETPTPLLEDVARPISADNPVGEDITYDDDFQALKDLIDQLSSVNPEGVDFDDIVKTCRDLLGQKAKDLRVSTYMAMAMAHTHGYPGILEGLVAQKLLIDAFWEPMYPPLRRMKARRGALQFMAERLTASAAAGTPQGSDHAILTDAIEVLKELQTYTMDVMEENAPVLSGLRKALEDALRKAPEPEPEAEAVPEGGDAPAEGAPEEEATAGDLAEETTEAGAPEEEAKPEAKVSLLDTLRETPTPLLEDVARPISADNPVGEDITYDDDFQALKDLIDQLSSVNPEGVDFDDIVKTCRDLLGQKAKDLRVSTYMAMAMAHTHGYPGILEGLVAQKLLIDAFWEPMYPPLRRMKARRGALQFMIERLTDTAASRTPAIGDKDAIEGSLEITKALQTYVMDVMDENAPVLSGLRKALDDALRKVPKPAPKEAPKPKAAAKPAASKQAASAGAGGTLAEPQSENEALDLMLSIAGFLREQNPANPLIYRLTRIVNWDILTEEPNSEKGATLLQDLPPHRLQYLNTLVEEKNWAELLNTSEAIFREPPYQFLLDLQRFASIAMDGLGEDYKQAKQAILLETAMLLKRLPGLTNLTFMDGQPFASPATQFWLEEEVKPVLASGKGGGYEEDKALTAQYNEAKGLSAEGNLAGAIKVLQEGARQDGSARSRFQRQLYCALLGMQSNQPEIACPFLEGLEAEIDRLRLERWDPDLAVEVWGHLHRCYEMLENDEELVIEGLAEQKRRVFGKICQTDITRILQAG